MVVRIKILYRISEMVTWMNWIVGLNQFTVHTDLPIDKNNEFLHFCKVVNYFVISFSLFSMIWDPGKRHLNFEANLTLTNGKSLNSWMKLMATYASTHFTNYSLCFQRLFEWLLTFRFGCFFVDQDLVDLIVGSNWPNTLWNFRIGTWEM